MSVVSLAGVTKRFAGPRSPVTAVDEMDLAVDEGEIVVLLGPSGCGKSTTLRLVAGLEVPCSGRVEICGQDVREVPPRDRDVAMVFQDYALYPHLSVYDNLAFGLRMRRTPKAEIAARVAEAVDLLGLSTLLDRRPHELSGGQQQRVAVGRAIVRRPNVFLFDEPLANLDAGARLRVRTEIERLQRSLGWTAMYVTHDQNEAMAVADRMVVMRDGKVQQFGRPAEVYRRPANRFVAGFVGAPPMNFIEGNLDSRGCTVLLATEGGSLALTGDVPPAVRNAGGSIVLGIRPERIRLSESAPTVPSLEVQVTHSEPVGDRTYVYTRDGAENDIVAQVDGDATLTEGTPVHAVPDLGSACFFDAGASGRLLGTIDVEASSEATRNDHARGSF